METKTLDNTTASQAKVNVSDLKIWGDGDTFKLICEASSKKEGWMKSTKAMEIPGVGCVVQVTTQQINDTGVIPFIGPKELKEKHNGQYPILESEDTMKHSTIAEAVTFVPGVMIEEIYAPREDDSPEKNCIGRRLVKMEYPTLSPKPE
jgi:hypothetical protein